MSGAPECSLRLIRSPQRTDRWAIRKKDVEFQRVTLRLSSALFLFPILTVAKCTTWPRLEKSADKAVVELKYEIAERAYLNAIRFAQQNSCDPNYVTISTISLAGVYKYQGRYSDSERLFLEADSLVPKIPRSFPGIEATLLNNLADLYLATARYADAEKLALRSVALRKREWGQKHPAYAISLSTLGEGEPTKGLERNMADTRDSAHGLAVTKSCDFGTRDYGRRK